MSDEEFERDDRKRRVEFMEYVIVTTVYSFRRTKGPSRSIRRMHSVDLQYRH